MTYTTLKILNLFQYILEVWIFLILPIRRAIFFIRISPTSTSIPHLNRISYYKLFQYKLSNLMSENKYRASLHKNHRDIYEYASFMFKPQNVVIHEDTNLPILLTNDRPEGWRYLREYEKSDWMKYKQSLKQQTSPNKKQDVGEKNKKKSFDLQYLYDKQKHILNKSLQQIQKEKRIYQSNQVKEKYPFLNKEIQSQVREKQKFRQRKYEISRQMAEEQQNLSKKNIKDLFKEVQCIKNMLTSKDLSKKDSCENCTSRRNRKQELLDKLQLQQSKSMKLLEQNIFLKETIKQLISNKEYLQLYVKQLNQNSSSKYFILILQELRKSKINQQDRQDRGEESKALSQQSSLRYKIQEDNSTNQTLLKKVEQLQSNQKNSISQISELISQLQTKEKFILKQQEQIQILKSAKTIFFSRIIIENNISQFIQKQINSFTKRRIAKSTLLYQKDKFNTNIFNYFDRQPFPVLILFQTINGVIFGSFAEGTQTYLTNRRNLEEGISIKYKVFLFNASQKTLFYEDQKNQKIIGLSFTQNHLRFGNNQMHLKNNNLDKITIPGSMIFGQKYFKMLNRKILTGQSTDVIEIKGLQIIQLQFQNE